ncbi:hypothetical protein SAMN05421788_10774 [Filimonas lacunae]|uniref:Cytochrome C and Quinol oxidase polypeptide I n=1 Tax=Filimonas lacunae TaxID=477680 RepID=A0A1N7QVR4_9BACT|nr:hypothetical protein [Filimonas lacunae]SIT26886.1 hypothetical protein SAMN05421788_10774 [Filimonas lacunae]
MEIHYKVIGTLLVLLSLLHAIFPKYFNWSEELSALSLINRQLMYVHTFFVALVVFLIGILCISSSAELTSTSLGKKIALGIGIFWFIRLLFQFFGYSSRLWKGKSFETAIHIAATLFWTYLSIVFLATWFV